MFKLALNAGHYKYTAGKRCHWEIDPKQTREWVLNDRICDKMQKMLEDYDGIEVLRIDDTSGEKDVALKDRTDKANKWGADFYLAIHHNAAGKKFSGGGIVAYVYTKPSAEALAWQKALYDASVKATGLKGNRSTPLAKKNLHEVRETKMPAVLMECGFMDSTIDCPIILTEEFADKIAKAYASVIIERSGATKKKPTVLYRIQVEGLSEKDAEVFAEELTGKGYVPTVTAYEAVVEGPKEDVPEEEPKEIIPEAFVPYKAQVNTPSGVKIRSGAGTNYAKVGSIKNKTVVTIVDESKGAGANLWGKLSDGRGWIAVDYTVRKG